MRDKLTIATRGSKLALWQAEHVRDRLIAKRPGLVVELEIIKTKGDKILDVPLAKVGGKGLFVKEIELALLDGRADLAVHSMKDVPADLEPGLVMGAVSERADPRDALCSRNGETLEALKDGATVGTSSLRRSCQLLAARPDLNIDPLRGNVPTRIQKMLDGKYDAIVLAAAGLERLGLAEHITDYLEADRCLPAVGQGVLGIEIRDGDDELSSLLAVAIHSPEVDSCVRAERSFLATLEGGCRTPIAAHAQLDGDHIWLRGLVGRLDGSEILRTDKRGSRSEPEKLGRAAAGLLLSAGADEILRELLATALN